jgi:hypothetical protein
MIAVMPHPEKETLIRRYREVVTTAIDNCGRKHYLCASKRQHQECVGAQQMITTTDIKGQARIKFCNELENVNIADRRSLGSTYDKLEATGAFGIFLQYAHAGHPIYIIVLHNQKVGFERAKTKNPHQHKAKRGFLDILKRILGGDRWT